MADSPYAPIPRERYFNDSIIKNRAVASSGASRMGSQVRPEDPVANVLKKTVEYSDSIEPELRKARIDHHESNT